jgi:hypothetical protein
MKKYIFFFSLVVLALLNLPAFSQAKDQAEKDTTLLGLPGDNLDLYAVIDLFQKSKTIEDFEKSLNEEKTGINNLDLNLDGKVDFIKVETKKNGDDFTFVLVVDVSKTEKQDVAVILVSKDKNKKVTMQIVGDKALYGDNYIVEPKTTKTPSSTPNPAYTGTEPVKEATPATTTIVIVEQTPIVQYVYSPVYVPYVPPYHYGYYPPYFAAFTVMAVGVYRHNHYAYHGGYGYHGNTTVIHNTYNYNSYNTTRNTSNTVNRNTTNGNYNRNTSTTRPSTGGSRPSTGATRPSTGDVRPSTGGARPSTGDVRPSTGNTKPSTGDARPSNKPSQTPSTRPSGGASTSDRKATPSTSNRQSTPSVNNRQSGSSSGSYNSGNRGGGGRSSGGSTGGGGRSGGGGGRGGGRR